MLADLAGHSQLQLVSNLITLFSSEPFIPSLNRILLTALVLMAMRAAMVDSQLKLMTTLSHTVSRARLTILILLRMANATEMLLLSRLTLMSSTR